MQTRLHSKLPHQSARQHAKAGDRSPPGRLEVWCWHLKVWEGVVPGVPPGEAAFPLEEGEEVAVRLALPCLLRDIQDSGHSRKLVETKGAQRSMAPPLAMRRGVLDAQ